MNDPVTWLDVVILLAVYLLAEGIWHLWLTWQANRELLNETGDEAAPDRPDGDSADTTRAVCTPAASSPQDGDD